MRTSQKLATAVFIFQLIMNTTPAAWFAAAIITGSGYYLLFALVAAIFLSYTTLGTFEALLKEFRKEE